MKSRDGGGQRSLSFFFFGKCSLPENAANRCILKTVFDSTAVMEEQGGGEGGC